MKQKEPRLGVFCRCGAQWSGRWVEKAADTIEDHRIRCGAPVAAQMFELLGHQVKWPNHWTDAECQTARSASLKGVARVG